MNEDSSWCGDSVVVEGLSVSLCPALIAIGQYSSTIETVDAGWCKEITDQGATQIARSSKSLRYLGLMRCDKVSSFTDSGSNRCSRVHRRAVSSGSLGHRFNTWQTETGRVQPTASHLHRAHVCSSHLLDHGFTNCFVSWTSESFLNKLAE